MELQLCALLHLHMRLLRQCHFLTHLSHIEPGIINKDNNDNNNYMFPIRRLGGIRTSAIWFATAWGLPRHGAVCMLGIVIYGTWEDMLSFQPHKDKNYIDVPTYLPYSNTHSGSHGSYTVGSASLTRKLKPAQMSHTYARRMPISSTLCLGLVSTNSEECYCRKANAGRLSQGE
jgi:hypothetical protein